MRFFFVVGFGRRGPLAEVPRRRGVFLPSKAESQVHSDNRRMDRTLELSDWWEKKLRS